MQKVSCTVSRQLLHSRILVQRNMLQSIESLLPRARFASTVALKASGVFIFNLPEIPIRCRVFEVQLQRQVDCTGILTCAEQGHYLKSDSMKAFSSCCFRKMIPSEIIQQFRLQQYSPERLVSVEQSVSRWRRDK